MPACRIRSCLSRSDHATAPAGFLPTGGATAGDVRHTLRTDMFGVHLTGRDSATVADTECFCLAGAGKCDLSPNHHDARIPIMCVFGVHFARLQASVENLVTLTPQLGFKLSLVHGQ